MLITELITSQAIIAEGIIINYTMSFSKLKMYSEEISVDVVSIFLFKLSALIYCVLLNWAVAFCGYYYVPQVTRRIFTAWYYC